MHSIFISIIYFNSRPHIEADDVKDLINERMVISTHSFSRKLTSAALISSTA